MIKTVGDTQIQLVQVPKDLHQFYLNDFGVTGKSYTDGVGMSKYVPNIQVQDLEDWEILGKLDTFTSDVAFLMNKAYYFDEMVQPLIDSWKLDPNFGWLVLVDSDIAKLNRINDTEKLMQLMAEGVEETTSFVFTVSYSKRMRQYVLLFKNIYKLSWRHEKLNVVLRAGIKYVLDNQLPGKTNRFRLR